MNSLDPRISAFIDRCDAVCRLRRIKRATLSTRILHDGKRLEQIAGGVSDIGVHRLARAEKDLAALEAEAEDAREVGYQRETDRGAA